jgi:mRNA interferase YafQ
MARRIAPTTKFEKDLKKVSKYPKFKRKEFETVINKIADGEKLDAKYGDHKLAKHSGGELQGCRDFHLVANICVVYRLTDDEVILVRIGSHQDIGLTEMIHIKG